MTLVNFRDCKEGGHDRNSAAIRLQKGGEEDNCLTADHARPRVYHSSKRGGLTFFIEEKRGRERGEIV